MSDVRDYLDAILGSAEGQLHIAIGVGPYLTDAGKYTHKQFVPSRFTWPGEADRAEREILRAAADSDAYVCPYLMWSDKRAKGAAVARPLVHADIDAGRLDAEKVRAIDGFAVASGTPGNGHAYVALTESVPGHWHRALCRGLGAYLGAVDAKISDNDVLRPPGTFNYKAAAAGGEPTAVQWLVPPPGVRVDPKALAHTLGVDLGHVTTAATNGHAQLAEQIDLTNHPRVQAAVARNTNDRSADTMRVVGACYTAGLTLPQTRYVVGTRADLAARLAERNDDDVQTCWLKAVDSRANTGPRETSCDDQNDDDEKEKKRSQATRLVEMGRANYNLGVTDTDEPYGAHPAIPHIALMLRSGKTGLRAELARRYFESTTSAASQQALADACMVLEGYARQENPRRVYLRVAEHDGAVFIDAGDAAADAHVIRISGGKWSVEVDAPVLFRRTKLTSEIAKPVRDGDLSRLWEFVPIDEADRPILLAVLIAALIQVDVPHVVLLLIAEQGSAKSSITRILVSLLDPSPVPLRQPPRDPDGWTTAAAASWVVALDNLSGQLPDWLSDSLCRASTGDGQVKRALYTDNDVAVTAYRRVVIANGVDVVVERGDLAERVVCIDVRRITTRRHETELAAAWAEAHSHVLGGLLDLAAKVHKRLATITVADMPRMADFARVLAVVDELEGTKGLDRYRERSKRVAADTLDDPFITELVERKLPFTDKTSAEILAALKPALAEWKPPRDWPKNARSVTGQLTRHAPALRAQGWFIEDDAGRNKRNRVQWTIRPPEKDGDPDSPDSPDSLGDDNHSSDGMGRGETNGYSTAAPDSPDSPDNSPDSPNWPDSPFSTTLTSEDELASQASHEYGASLVLCSKCGQEMSAPTSISRGHCERCHLTSKQGGVR